MKKISFVVGRDYQQNRIFDLSDKRLNRDNCLYSFFLLKEEFQKRGYELITSDLLSPKDADLVLYNEMPKPMDWSIDPKKSYLMLFESELIRKDNWDATKHTFFKKIFTWHDDYVDQKKYIKFNFPNEIKTTKVGLEGRSGFLISISGNKTSFHPLELYSERVKTIKWFESNHPTKLDYYGVGWEYKIDLKWQKVFKKLHLTSLLPVNKSPSFKGRVEQKLEALRRYKFSLCYENGKDINGYITEKIFDCFFAGTIPVYWGPQNITTYIPANCFIDRTKFKTDLELYNYLSGLSDDEIINFQKNIEIFLSSDQMKLFSNPFFASHIVQVVLNE